MATTDPQEYSGEPEFETALFSRFQADEEITQNFKQAFGEEPKYIRIYVKYPNFKIAGPIPFRQLPMPEPP